MSKIVKTWLLETEDGETVFVDKDGNYGLENVAGTLAAEFREGEHPGDDKDKRAEAVSKIVGVSLHCVRGPDWTEHQVYG